MASPNRGVQVSRGLVQECGENGAGDSQIGAALAGMLKRSVVVKRGDPNSDSDSDYFIYPRREIFCYSSSL